MMYMYTYSAQSVILTRVSHGSGGTIYYSLLQTTWCLQRRIELPKAARGHTTLIDGIMLHVTKNNTSCLSRGSRCTVHSQVFNGNAP